MHRKGADAPIDYSSDFATAPYSTTYLLKYLMKFKAANSYQHIYSTDYVSNSSHLNLYIHPTPHHCNSSSAISISADEARG